MSLFLSLKSDPISQPSAEEPLERLTWCSLRIQVGSRFASRLWDKCIEDEREYIDIPAFPIAEWFIRNWWSLFNELCPWESVPRNPKYDAKWLTWTKRHCLRAADSALFLPKLFLYSDGHSLRAEWHADRPDSLPNMPGEFISDGVEQLNSETTEAALTRFISHTLSRVEGTPDARATAAAEQWNAIQNSDVEEREFCVLAGRMGINPYDSEELTDILARFFEEILTDAEEPLVRDLTEVAQPEVVQDQWSWVNNASRALELGPLTSAVPVDLPSGNLSPPEYGYRLARSLREASGLGLNPIHSVEEVASVTLNAAFRVEYKNHIPGYGIKAIVGQSSSGAIVAAGPKVFHHYNRRFMAARSVFHAIATSRESQRLVTDAFSWDQKASRAFAAEFLAPQRALVNGLTRSIADSQTVRNLSREFHASPMVIQKQLENAGVLLSID